MKVFSTGLFVILFAAAIAAAATEAPGFSFSGDTEFFCGSAVPARNSAPVVLPPHDGPVTVDISIAGFAFTPDNLTINVGDTVRWTNNDGRSHTTTSDSLVWDSGGLSPADTFSFTFNDAGVFPYHCNIHTFMTASITVQGASPTPTPSGSLVINEIDYDQPNMDAAEFIELKNVSGGMINLDPVVVELINGAACCTPYATIDLPNVDLAPGAYYVICGNAAAVPNCDLDVTPDTNLIQNGAPDAIGLRISGTLVDTVSYEGDTGAPYTEGSGVGLIDDGVATDSGISRFPDGQDTGVNNVDLSQRCVTPGSANSPAMCNGSPTPTGTATITSTPTATATATNTPTSTPTPAETPSVSGVITYGNAIGSPAPPRFVKNVSVAGTGMPLVGPVLTGLNGEYTLIGFGSGPYTILPTKPSGPNTAVTSNDAARVAQGVSGSVPFISNNQRYSSDASGNGTISSNDAALIARFAAGLTGFGNTGQWKFFCPPGPNWPPPGPTQTCNSFPSVNGPITGVDMIALLVGEASGNYNPATHPRGTVESGKWKVESEEGDLEKPITIAAQPVMAGADKEIVVPVSVEGAAGKDVISYEFNVRYDPSVIRPMGDPVDVLGTVSRGLLVVTNPFEPGLLRVVVYGPMPIDEDGVLLNLRFTAVGKAGSVSPLTFERVMFNEGEPRVLVSDGRVGLF